MQTRWNKQALYGQGKVYCSINDEHVVCVTINCCNGAMAYTWAVVVAGVAFLTHYTKLPWVLFPVLLFGVFVASRGKSFPRIFFRTVLRDLR